MGARDDKPRPEAGKAPEGARAAREARLAMALRANLRRRKSAAKAAPEPPSDD